MRNRTVLLIVVSLCLLVPAAVRFSFALVLAAAVMYMMFAVTGIRLLVSRFLAGPLAQISELCFSVLAAVLFERCIAAFSPVLASLLYMYFFLAAVSACLLLYGRNSFDDGIPAVAAVKFKAAFFKGLQFAAYILPVGAVREILGTGGISFPSVQGFTACRLFDVPDYYFLKFAVSPGGMLILLGMIVALSKFMRKQMNIAKRIRHE